MKLPLLWLGFTGILGTLGTLIDSAREGGTLGGQALLFGAVAALGWVVVALFKGLNKSNADTLAATIETTKQLLAASNSQRDEDRKHHEELVQAFKSERSTNLAERGSNFQTLLTIARDSAVAVNASSLAMGAMTAAAANTQQMCHDTASAIRDLCVAFREMKMSAHEDHMNPREQPSRIVNTVEDRVPVTH